MRRAWRLAPGPWRWCRALLAPAVLAQVPKRESAEIGDKQQDAAADPEALLEERAESGGRAQARSGRAERARRHRSAPQRQAPAGGGAGRATATGSGRRRRAAGRDRAPAVASLWAGGRAGPAPPRALQAAGPGRRAAHRALGGGPGGAGGAAPAPHHPGLGGRPADSRVSCDVRGAGGPEEPGRGARREELASLRSEAEQERAEVDREAAKRRALLAKVQRRARLPRPDGRRAVRSHPPARGVHPRPAGQAAAGGGEGAAAEPARPAGAGRRGAGLRRPARAAAVAGRRAGRRGVRSAGASAVRNADVPERDRHRGGRGLETSRRYTPATSSIRAGSGATGT